MVICSILSAIFYNCNNISHILHLLGVQEFEARGPQPYDKLTLPQLMVEKYHQELKFRVFYTFKFAEAESLKTLWFIIFASELNDRQRQTRTAVRTPQISSQLLHLMTTLGLKIFYSKFHREVSNVAKLPLTD